MFYISVILVMVTHYLFYKYKLYGKYIRNPFLNKIQKGYTYFFNTLNRNIPDKFNRYLQNTIVICVFLGYFIFLIIVLDSLLENILGKNICGYDEDGEYLCQGNIYLLVYISVLIHKFLNNKRLLNPQYKNILKELNEITKLIPNKIIPSYLLFKDDFISILEKYIITTGYNGKFYFYQEIKNFSEKKYFVSNQIPFDPEYDNMFEFILIKFIQFIEEKKMSDLKYNWYLKLNHKVEYENRLKTKKLPPIENFFEVYILLIKIAFEHKYINKDTFENKKNKCFEE
jgi:hypothetical protein